MKEDFLHYVWQYKKFDFSNLKTSNGDLLLILNSGQYLQLSGPDFFNAQIILNEQKWAGNIEIHVKSSDWYLHQHEKDAAYDSVILHVVWEHDTEIALKDGTILPTLVLQEKVPAHLFNNYQNLVSAVSTFPCENQLKEIDEFVVNGFLSRVLVERLSEKSLAVEEKLKELQEKLKTEEEDIKEIKIAVDNEIEAINKEFLSNGNLILR